jgi:hypothetical protein
MGRSGFSHLELQAVQSLLGLTIVRNVFQRVLSSTERMFLIQNLYIYFIGRNKQDQEALGLGEWDKWVNGSVSGLMFSSPEINFKFKRGFVLRSNAKR